MFSQTRPVGPIALLIIALLSSAVSVYLTIIHYSNNVPLVCATAGMVNCELVLSSTYANIPGTPIPVAISGLLWSAVAAVLSVCSWFLLTRRQTLALMECIWGGIGLLAVLYLVYVELVYIRAICAWCTVVHVLVLLYFLIAVAQWQSSNAVVDEEVEEEEEVSIPT